MGNQFQVCLIWWTTDVFSALKYFSTIIISTKYIQLKHSSWYDKN